jgi:DNA-binding response OmpR family regulator
MEKVLVIDDDSLVRDTIVRILERKGYQVLVASDGVRGLRMFRSEQPDLVIIAISGGGRIGNVDFLKIAEKLGASEIIAKPFDPSVLVNVVSRCLGAPA